MKEIKGYVCWADAGNRDFLYGKGTDKPYSNLTLNKITPYSVKKEAIRGRTALVKDFGKEFFRQIRIAVFNLELAEDYKESQEILKRKKIKGLIIVTLPAEDQPGGESYLFLGKRTSDANLYRGQIKRFNGSEDFTGKENFFESLGIISEIGRQVQLYGRLAIIRLNVVK